MCYYKGKLMGRCTVADGEAFSLLMKQCDHDAARVLREYSYFSPELKGILEKVAGVQAGQSRQQTAPGLFAQPDNSPWGEVQTCDILCPGVFMVSTASHGGTMVSKDMTAALSTAALKCGMMSDGHLCFEEDSAENVVLRELLDKKLWGIPDRVKDRAAFEENINRGLREYHPEYWRSRQSGIEAAQARKPVRDPAHSDR
jgi:hypothetical protein